MVRSELKVNQAKDRYFGLRPRLRNTLPEKERRRSRNLFQPGVCCWRMTTPMIAKFLAHSSPPWECDAHQRPARKKPFNSLRRRLRTKIRKLLPLSTCKCRE